MFSNTRRFFAIGTILVLGPMAMTGCSAALGAAGRGAPASAIVHNPQTQMGAFTNQARSGQVTAESACVQPVPNSSNCIGAVVVSRPGVFRPSVVAVIPVDCRIDPNCTPGPAMGGVGEPMANVAVNGISNIAAAAVGGGRSGPGVVVQNLNNADANATNNNTNTSSNRIGIFGGLFGRRH